MYSPLRFALILIASSILLMAPLQLSLYPLSKYSRYVIVACPIEVRVRIKRVIHVAASPLSQINHNFLTAACPLPNVSPKFAMFILLS